MLNENNVMLAYANDNVIFDDTKNDIVNITEKLIEFDYRMNLA